MTKTIIGFCPEQGKDYQISVSYLEANPQSGHSYMKGLSYCEYNQYGDCRHKGNCPLLNKAPKFI